MRKIIAAGSVTFLNLTEVGALARYQSDGELDPTFNPSSKQPGTIITFFGRSYYSQSGINALALQHDGTIIAGAGPGAIVAEYLADNHEDEE